MPSRTLFPFSEAQPHESFEMQPVNLTLETYNEESNEEDEEASQTSTLSNARETFRHFSRRARQTLRRFVPKSEWVQLFAGVIAGFAVSSLFIFPSASILKEYMASAKANGSIPFITPQSELFYQESMYITSSINDEYIAQFVDPSFVNSSLASSFTYNLESFYGEWIDWVDILTEAGFSSLKGGFLNASKIYRIVSGFYNNAKGEADLFCEQMKHTTFFRGCSQELKIDPTKAHLLGDNCVALRTAFSGFIQKEIQSFAKFFGESPHDIICSTKP